MEMHQVRTRFSGLVVCALLSACSGTSVDRPDRPFVGKTWISTDSSAAPGTLRIFLPDGTLLMDSCLETYRLAKWRAIDDRHIEWQEDTARIEAEITQATADQLQLRLRLVSEVKEENYRLAQVPFVCPDAR
jgi:hypothetical protein